MSDGWKVESESEAGKVTVRIISPEGDLAEAEMDPAEAKAFGDDLIEQSQVAVIEMDAELRKMTGEEWSK